MKMNETAGYFLTVTVSYGVVEDDVVVSPLEPVGVTVSVRDAVRAQVGVVRCQFHAEILRRLRGIRFLKEIINIQ